jgi:hypothetical protein
MQKKEVIPRILAKESVNLELWLKCCEGLKFHGPFCKFPEKNQKIGFFGLFLYEKIRGLGPRGVDRGATGPPWSGSHCHAWELTGARPPAAPMPESSDQAVGEGKEGPMSSTAGSPRVGRLWRGVGFSNGGDGGQAQE